MTIPEIVDHIFEYGNLHMTHPNDTVKLFAASRLVDLEVAKRMSVINETTRANGTIFVGHC